MTTVTRADIAETICAEIGLSRKDAGDILDMVIDEIKGELISGKDVKISSFGIEYSLIQKDIKIISKINDRCIFYYKNKQLRLQFTKKLFIHKCIGSNALHANHRINLHVLN